MTFVPPPSDPASYSNPRLSSLAVTSLILGAIAVPAGIFIVGGLLGVVAIILAIIALVTIGKRPAQLGGKGFAAAGLALGVFSIAVVPASLYLRAQWELDRRVQCAKNLRAISMACVIYANENSDVFPTVPYAPYSPALNSTAGSPGAASADDTLLSMYNTPPANTAGSPTACLWILVLKQQVDPAQFICPSDTFAGNPAQTMESRRFYNNFQKPDQISYSIAYPWHVLGSDVRASRSALVGGWWKNQTDASLPILSDIAPLTKDPETNSPVHAGAGQNVAFGDAHVEFARTPLVGHGHDNMFTSGPAPGAPVNPAAFMPPTSANAAPFDTVMVPVR